MMISESNSDLPYQYPDGGGGFRSVVYKCIRVMLSVRVADIFTGTALAIGSWLKFQHQQNIDILIISLPLN